MVTCHTCGRRTERRQDTCSACLKGTTTHVIEPAARPPLVGDVYRALCGVLVAGNRHSTEPACVNCCRQLAEDENTARRLAQLPGVAQPVKHVDFDPTTGQPWRRR